MRNLKINIYLCAWTKPVSKKFYNHLIDKVSGILDTLRAPWVMEQIRTFIDNYLTSREINSSLDLRYSPFVIFITLRPEIDAAIERSAAARRRAALRREAAQETPTPESPAPEAPTEEGNDIMKNNEGIASVIQMHYLCDT